MFFDIFSELCELRGISRNKAASDIGLSNSAQTKWRKDGSTPRGDTLDRIAAYFGVSTDYLLGKEKTPTNGERCEIPKGFSPMPERERVPRVGRIACGDPITAEENIEDYDEVLKSWHADFTLVCAGDSMLPKIEDGDVVAIRAQPEVHNGEVAAVRIGDEATLKLFFLHDDYIELRPINPAYQSIIRRREEMNDVHIEGKAVGLCRNL